jgi:glyoxylase-like metal-dependent hydrolase (beta-lactamase superfamily II)
MIEDVAPRLLRFSFGPVADGVNMYLIGDVLVDSGVSWTAAKLRRALEGRSVAGHAITHAHFDHQGASHFIAEALGIPVWCGEGDREALESGDPATVLLKPRGEARRFARALAGPAHPVSRTLREGDEVGGFTVIESPGHTPGHIAFWRSDDRVLVLGDVLFNRNPVTLRRGLAEPFAIFTWDPAVNRASARKLAALGPELICFGHGAPLRDAEAFQRFVARLPG